MSKILSELHPFTKEQNIYIYFDQDKIDTITTDLDHFNDTILGLTTEYGIDEVDLSGSKLYVNGIIKSLKEAEKTKYSKNNLQINYIK